MQTENIRKTTLAISLLSILPHLLCCGIPVVLALISLGTTVGLATALATNPLYNFVDHYHTQLLFVAVIGVVTSGFFNLIAYRMDCKAMSDLCTHDSCAPKKTKSFKIFFISLILLFVDIAWFATEEYVLGLHNHNHHEAHEDHHHEH
ncbi:MAG TPA: hypothetical protein DIV86_04765 [Alphaproteobacteria bacterium]|nr:hypothetical protein [Alphaproteobacteria bacterium]